MWGWGYVLCARRRNGGGRGIRTPKGLAARWISSPDPSPAPSYTIGAHRRRYEHLTVVATTDRARWSPSLFDGSGKARAKHASGDRDARATARAGDGGAGSRGRVRRKRRKGIALAHYLTSASCSPRFAASTRWIDSPRRARKSASARAVLAVFARAWPVASEVA